MPADRADLVDEYRGRETAAAAATDLLIASSVKWVADKYRVNEARAVEFMNKTVSAVRRFPYGIIAEYLWRGGHITYGDPSQGKAPGSYDPRSDKRVSKDAGIVDPEERFAPVKASRLLGTDTEYGTDEGLRFNLADTDAYLAIEDDDAPISDTRKSAGALLMRDLSSFFHTTRTVPNP